MKNMKNMKKNLGAICYTGNKQKLLSDLKPKFPKYKRFVDVCCGGLSVSLNVDGPVLSNDIQRELIDMYESMKKYSISDIKKMCEKYNLSKTNKKAYYSLREEYNTSKEPILLLLLQFYSFSNIIRFNNDGLYNAGFGKREINKSSIEKLEHFYKNIDKIKFTSCSFEDIEIETGDFVYIDPPYLITEAAYNSLWGEQQENALYKWLDDLNGKGIKFGVSNVLFHRNKENLFLQKFREKYNTHFLEKDYVFCAHHAKERAQKTVEFLSQITKI